MTTRTRRTPIHTKDHDGQDIVLVPLANHPEPAKVLTADFERLMEKGYSDQWTYNPADFRNSYVRCTNTRVAGSHETVARILLAPGRGHIVRYHDSDHLNLRTDNLYINKGWAKGQTIVSVKQETDEDD